MKKYRKLFQVLLKYQTSQNIFKIGDLLKHRRQNVFKREDRQVSENNKNIENFNLTNVEVVKAYAPVELDIYNDVDAIFLGGTGNKLEEIIDWSKDLLVPGGRLVANFIIIDTFYEMLRLVREKGFKNVDVTVLNVSKLEKLGPGEYFKPHNPIYIISCEKGVE